MSEKPQPPTEEEIKKLEQQQAEENKRKIENLAKALDLPRMNEDIALVREEVHSVAQNLNKLCEALNSAQTANQSQQSQNHSQTDDIPPEQKMLLLKDGIAGIADLVKAWKGTTMPPQMQQQNDFQSMIMQSFAKMIQAKVDETIFSTYGTQIPIDQLQQVRQIQQQAANLAPQQPTTPRFEK